MKAIKQSSRQRRTIHQTLSRQHNIWLVTAVSKSKSTTIDNLYYQNQSRAHLPIHLQLWIRHSPRRQSDFLLISHFNSFETTNTHSEYHFGSKSFPVERGNWLLTMNFNIVFLFSQWSIFFFLFSQWLVIKDWNQYEKEWKYSACFINLLQLEMDLEMKFSPKLAGNLFLVKMVF